MEKENRNKGFFNRKRIVFGVAVVALAVFFYLNIFVFASEETPSRPGELIENIDVTPPASDSSNINIPYIRHIQRMFEEIPSGFRDVFHYIP